MPAPVAALTTPLYRLATSARLRCRPAVSPAVPASRGACLLPVPAPAAELLADAVPGGGLCKRAHSDIVLATQPYQTHIGELLLLELGVDDQLTRHDGVLCPPRLLMMTTRPWTSRQHPHLPACIRTFIVSSGCIVDWLAALAIAPATTSCAGLSTPLGGAGAGLELLPVLETPASGAFEGRAGALCGQKHI